MPSLDVALVVVTGVALFAAFVNGAIGYGFSSLTVPLALVFYTNRVLNPAVVLIEVLILRRIYKAPELFQLLATFAVVFKLARDSQLRVGLRRVEVPVPRLVLIPR